MNQQVKIKSLKVAGKYSKRARLHPNAYGICDKKKKKKKKPLSPTCPGTR
jgi:tRNA U54 and U55 pseudouridine synthase Pus10